jgi:predicted Zn-dependent protease
MPEKKPKAKRPKNYAKLSQKEKFIAAAKEFEADETGKTFLASFKTIAKQKGRRTQ